MWYIVLSFTAVLQRVASASVTVDSNLISSIGKGVLVFAAIASEDTKKEVESMAAKVLKMKLWPDETGATVCFRTCVHIVLTHTARSGSKMCKISRERSFVVCRRCLRQLRPSLTYDPPIAVSQFTLLASTRKGNKPDFHGAAGGELAKELYDHFFAQVQELYEPEKVKNGVFQAMMEGSVGPLSFSLHLLTIWKSTYKILGL